MKILVRENMKKAIATLIFSVLFFCHSYGQEIKTITLTEQSPPLEIISLAEMTSLRVEESITIPFEESIVICFRSFYRYDVEYKIKGWSEL